MTQERKELRIGRYVLAAILPVFLILFGIDILLGDGVITGWFVATYLVLPLAAFGACVLVIRSRKARWVKVLVCMVLMVVMIVAFVYAMALGHYAIHSVSEGEEALSDYQADTQSIEAMPAVEALGQPESVEYHYYFNMFATFFDSDCYVLFCQYSQADYEQQKVMLAQKYIFQEEEPSADGYAVEPEFEVDGYRFRFLSFGNEEYRLLYPKEMMLVGTNDDTNEVVYLYYSDDDLDYISSLEDHIMNDFGWKYIR